MKKLDSSSNLFLPHEHEKRMEDRLRTMNDNGITDNHERTKVTVRVPASSANLGPGFDTVGMALDMWSEFTVERSDQFEITCEGEGEKDMPRDQTNLVCFGVAAAFAKAEKPLPTLKYHLINRIPYARGLGSSSAAIVGGLVAGLVLAGHQVKAWGAEDLLNMAADIEGHPDNVAPVVYGGIQLGIHNGSRWMTERVNVPPGLQCVCFIPDTIGKTSTARGVLPDTISRKEAIFNIGRVAFLINALATNNIDSLRYGVEDALHQPQRAAAVYPFLQPIINAAVEAGASAGYLSGAGPTVMALTSGASGDIFTQRTKERVDRKVAEAMLEAAAKFGVKGNVFITAPVMHGAYVVSAEPSFSHGLVRYKDDV
ncbi:ribosomal protein S5 domain 2-type protein [Ochromonadaceae sp. CCMP2298]|nr:ribosomal protein S5 domain 2-type protein [Ochromonadaceae sp. CCMP2298]